MRPLAQEHRRRSASRGAAGFTLIEVVVALGLMVLIGSSVMAIVTTTFQSINTLTLAQMRRQEVSGLIDLLSISFRQIPGDGHVLLQPTDGGSDGSNDVLVRRAPKLFSFGREVYAEPESFIQMRKTAGQYFVMGVFRRQISNVEGSTFDNEGKWLPLVGDVVEAKWRFYNATGGQWLENWRNPEARPSAIELVLTLAEDPDVPLRCVFWVPPIEPPPPPPQIQEDAPDPNAPPPGAVDPDDEPDPEEEKEEGE